MILRTRLIRRRRVIDPWTIAEPMGLPWTIAWGYHTAQTLTERCWKVFCTLRELHHFEPHLYEHHRKTRGSSYFEPHRSELHREHHRGPHREHHLGPHREHYREHYRGPHREHHRGPHRERRRETRSSKPHLEPLFRTPC